MFSQFKLNRKQLFEGEALWAKYKELNGFSLFPSNKGVKRLAEQEGLEEGYVKRCLTLYLDEA